MRKVRNRWGELILLPIMMLILTGCSLFSPPAGSVSRTDVVENDLVKFSRTVPAKVEQGEVFTVVSEVEAKASLMLVAIAEALPAGFILESGELTIFDTSLEPGDRLKTTYQVQAGSATGSFLLKGEVRAKPIDGDSKNLELESEIELKASR